MSNPEVYSTAIAVDDRNKVVEDDRGVKKDFKGAVMSIPVGTHTIDKNGIRTDNKTGKPMGRVKGTRGRTVEDTAKASGEEMSM